MNQLLWKTIGTLGSPLAPLDWIGWGEKLATAWAKILEVLHQLCSSTAQEVEPQVPLSMPAHVSVCIDTQSTFSLLLQNHSSIQGGTRAFPLIYTRPTAGISLYKTYIFHKRRHPGHKPLPFTLHQMYLSSPDSHKFQQLCKRQKECLSITNTMGSYCNMLWKTRVGRDTKPRGRAPSLICRKAWVQTLAAALWKLGKKICGICKPSSYEDVPLYLFSWIRKDIHTLQGYYTSLKTRVEKVKQ